MAVFPDVGQNDFTCSACLPALGQKPQNDLHYVLKIVPIYFLLPFTPHCTLWVW